MSLLRFIFVFLLNIYRQLKLHLLPHGVTLRSTYDDDPQIYIYISSCQRIMLLLAHLINRQDVVFDELRMLGSFGCRQCR